MSLQPRRLRDGLLRLIPFLLLVGSATAIAETPEEKGLQIAEEADHAGPGGGALRVPGGDTHHAPSVIVYAQRIQLGAVARLVPVMPPPAFEPRPGEKKAAGGD